MVDVGVDFRASEQSLANELLVSGFCFIFVSSKLKLTRLVPVPVVEIKLKEFLELLRIFD